VAKAVDSLNLNSPSLGVLYQKWSSYLKARLTWEEFRTGPRIEGCNWNVEALEFLDKTTIFQLPGAHSHP
jgi:hypothetical protein